MFHVGSSDDAQDGSTNIMNDVKLNEDEIKILSYIQQNGFITNAVSREEFGLTKHRSTDLFNSLLLKEKIERIGGGNQNQYILKEK